MQGPQPKPERQLGLQPELQAAAAAGSQEAGAAHVGAVHPTLQSAGGIGAAAAAAGSHAAAAAAGSHAAEMQPEAANV